MKMWKIAFFLFFISIVKCNNLAIILNYTNSETDNSQFFELFESIQKQRAVDSVLWVKPKDIQLMLPTNFPMLIYDAAALSNATFAYRTHFNQEILTIVTLLDVENIQNILENLAAVLEDMRFARILLYFPHLNTTQKLHNIFEICYNLKMLFVIAVFANFSQTQLIYAFSAFANNKIHLIHYNNDSEIYANPLDNLNAHKVRVIADQLEPRTMLYIDQSGNKQLTGFLYKLILAFSQKHNATLEYAYAMEPGKVLYYGDLAKQTYMGLLDIPMIMIPLVSDYDSQALSYPFDQMNYCLMLPLPPRMPVKEIYIEVINLDIQIMSMVITSIYSALYVLSKQAPHFRWRWWELILHLEVLRAFLDQPMLLNYRVNWKLRFICLQLILFLFLENSMYSAYLNSMLTSPPFQSRVRTLADFRQRNLDVIAADNEFRLFITNNKHASEFWLDPLVNLTLKLHSFKEFQRLRNAMVPGHAYTVTDNRWQYFQERQRFFERPLFYFDDSLCFSNMMLLPIPLQKNSIYREALNRLILQIHQSGLRLAWITQSFFDMVRLKRFTGDDLSPPLTYGGPLKFNDLDLLLSAYYYGMAISCCALILEFCWYLNSKRKNKKRKIVNSHKA